MSKSALGDAMESFEKETEERAKQRADGTFDYKEESRFARGFSDKPTEPPMTRIAAKRLCILRGIDPPNYNHDCGHHGSNLTDHPAPYIRRFPNAFPRKRRVCVTFTSYDGLGGRHTYAKMREEENPIWTVDADPTFRRDNGHWVECWKDDIGEGANVSERCMSKLDADRWVRETFAVLFNPKTHVLVEDFSDKRWHYKEGD